MGYRIFPSIKLGIIGAFYHLNKTKISEEEKTVTNYSIGFEIQKDILQYTNYHVYIIGGGYYYHDDENKYEITHTITDSNNFGLGLGYEYFFHRVFLDIEIGEKYFSDSGTIQDFGGNKLNEINKQTKLGGGISIGILL